MGITIDPLALQPGEWFVWHELKPTPYRVVEVLRDERRIVAVSEQHLSAGPIPWPTSVAIDGRRFERAPVPVSLRRPLPTEVGTVILARTQTHGLCLLALIDNDSHSGLRWVDTGSGEWASPADVEDWRMIDGVDTVPHEG